MVPHGLRSTISERCVTAGFEGGLAEAFDPDHDYLRVDALFQ